MNLDHLDKLFKPTSVAVIGATNDPDNPGNVVMRNMMAGTFLGPVMPLNPELSEVLGVPCSAEVDELPLTPDLGIVCTEPERTPYYITELGKRGTRAAVVLSLGGFRSDAKARAAYNKKLLAAAKPFGLRLLGPNCLGYINPKVGLNASLAHRDAKQGRVAFVSQSDSLFTAVLDWATSRGIGFSQFVSLGDRVDINFGTMLDYLNADPYTRGVLLYVETIDLAREFMSAARATGRNKPIVVIKVGRSEAGARASAAHSGSYLGSDDVYDAAFRRAGMLRVFDIESLFDAMETLALAKLPQGDRLAIITNGGGPGFLATDALALGGARLANFSDETKEALRAELGMDYSYLNPLILKTTQPELYGKAIKPVLADKGVDALLVMHTPTFLRTGVEAAKEVAEACRRTKKLVFTSWLGVDAAEEARQVFAEASIPTFFTPGNAVRGFLNMVQYRRNQEMLMESPASIPGSFQPDTFAARDVIRGALAGGRQTLNETESKAILAAYDIPVVESRLVSDMDGIEGAAEAAEELGYPVAVKILSDDIAHKSQAGGVALDLEGADAVREAAEAIIARVRVLRPKARIQGFTVQKMMRRVNAQKLYVETATDPVFGPIIRFGAGGDLTEVLADRQTALPPLNMSLAHELISRTNIYRLLLGHGQSRAADLDAVCLTLVKISQLLIDIPEIFELEINPLFADAEGVLALDAHIHAAAAKSSGAEQMAIRPYPNELEECALLRDGRQVHLRPIRPEDEPSHWEFVEAMSPEDRRFRFFGNIGELPRTEMIKLTQIDYNREMAFIARGALEGTVSCSVDGVDPKDDGSGMVKTLGVVRAMTKPDNSEAEFAVAIRSDCKRLGLGRILMEKIIRYCKTRGTHEIVGQGLLENKGMRMLAEAVGFAVSKNYEDDVYDFRMELNKPEE